MLQTSHIEHYQREGYVVVPQVFSPEEVATLRDHYMALRAAGSYPGDVLFFNGSLIHGSYPNTSKDRFRRSLIGHYIAGEAEKVAAYYHPVLRMDGSEVRLGVSEHGGPCGIWRDRDGRPVVEMTQQDKAPAGATHE